MERGRSQTYTLTFSRKITFPLVNKGNNSKTLLFYQYDDFCLFIND